jgi:hypothetical protein
LPFIGITPCRLVDTTNAAFPATYGPPALIADTPRSFDLNSDPQCPGIPASAQAYSLNITAAGTQGPGFIVIYPQGGAVPVVSTLNYVGGQTIANAAVVAAGASGGVTVIAGTSGTHLIIDINGYYAPAGVGTSNTFLGLNAGNFTMTGDGNTAVGASALFSNTTGFQNTAIGVRALQETTMGDNNTAVGDQALLGNTQGNANTAIGENALYSNTTGNFNIALGTIAGFYTTGSNNICIGNTGVTAESGTIRIGTAGTQTATFLAGITGAAVTGVPVLVSSSGQLGVASSSRSVKEDIREIAGESDGLMKLRPVAFRYKPQIDPTGLAQYGLIAEEVAGVYPDLVTYDRDGQPETVRYHLVNALLLNEAQKQHRTLEVQEITIEQQKAEIEGLNARLSRLEARLLAESRP